MFILTVTGYTVCFILFLYLYLYFVFGLKLYIEQDLVIIIWINRGILKSSKDHGYRMY